MGCFEQVGAALGGGGRGKGPTGELGGEGGDDGCIFYGLGPAGVKSGDFRGRAQVVVAGTVGGYGGGDGGRVGDVAGPACFATGQLEAFVGGGIVGTR